MRITFVGDVVPNRAYTFSVAAEKYLSQADVCVMNLEGALPGTPSNKAGPHVGIDRENFKLFGELFHVASMANNHAMDYGEGAARETKSMCAENGVAVVGLGKDVEEAFTLARLDDNTVLLAVAEHEFGAAGRDRYGIATTDELRMLWQTINAAHDRGQTVIVCAHGGSEVLPVPPPKVRELYRAMIDWGADLVIGSHPHVPQGWEDYHQGRIYYSLGNFAFHSDESIYQNYNWSLVVTYDTETRDCSFMSSSVKDGEIDIHSERLNETLVLCDALNSTDYDSLYLKCANFIGMKRYQQMMETSDPNIPLRLHWIRTPSHRNNIELAMSMRMAEIVVGETKEWDVTAGEGDSVWLKRI